MAEKVSYYATGRRKNSTAKVRLVPGEGKIIVNQKDFKEYFNRDIEDLNYSNLCFFRSPDMDHFEPSDWELAIPLFEDYVHYVNPAWALMLGKPPSQLKKHISNYKRHEVINENNGYRVFGYTGTLFGKYPFGSVPHTESQISSESRHQIWNDVVNNILKSALNNG